MTLPFHQHLTESDARKVAAALKRAVAEAVR
ncbi:dTDP-4-amino-4,6-dideoxygalactose transaminase [Kitasatospora sp. GP82]|nr:dTDP-4-amino-4,6-dideoxygalactose transaminase [Kitasatospora sp. GP82]